MRTIKLPFKTGVSFTYDRRVFFYETDAAGILNNINMFKLFEEARTCFLEEVGSVGVLWSGGEEKSEKSELSNTTFVVRHTEATYKKTAQFNDRLKIILTVGEIKAASFTLDYVVRREADLIAKGSVTLVAIDLQTRRPIALEYT